MVTETRLATDEAQIRELVDNWVKAVRAKDINELMSFYPEDILLFDIMPPLEHRGVLAHRKNWEACFPYFPGSIDYEIRNLSITAGSDVAFSSSLNRMSGTMTNGEEVNFWMRATVCYKKIDGKWMVVHEHVSVPIDMESNKALFDLKP
jgi:uncharacterized protein (TIGR02246 family)